MRSRVHEFNSYFHDRKFEYNVHIPSDLYKCQNILLLLIIIIMKEPLLILQTEDKQPWIRYNTTQPLINYNISAGSHINRTVTWTESAEAFIGWTTAQYHSKPADHYIWLTGYVLMQRNR